MNDRSDAKLRSCEQCNQPIPADAPGGICPVCALAGAMDDKELMDRTSAHKPLTAAELSAFLPQYGRITLLGVGGMGTVYRATHKNLKRPVAIKILHGSRDSVDNPYERFEREAEALASLDHPNVVRVYDYGIVEELHYIVMEYIDGVTLREAFRTISDSRVKAEQALQVVSKVCAGLAAAHAKGLVHRDVKPENVMVSRDGKVKVIDFGIAKRLDRLSHQMTKTGWARGTHIYAAPEQFEDPDQVDHRADIYAVGVVLYEMLTGQLPVGNFEPPSIAAGVSCELDAIVAKALHKRKERRYASAAEMDTAVRRVTRPLPVAFPCVFCKREVQVDRKMEGQTVNCPHCGQALEVKIGASKPRPIQFPQRKRRKSNRVLTAVLLLLCVSAAVVLARVIWESRRDAELVADVPAKSLPERVEDEESEEGIPLDESENPGESLSTEDVPSLEDESTATQLADLDKEQVTREEQKPLEALLVQAKTKNANRVVWEKADGGNGHAYEAFPKQLNWFDARDDAVAAGGYLATITSAEENEFVFGLVDHTEFWTDYGNKAHSWGPWLGGFRSEGEIWGWINGDEFNYSYWFPGEPSNDHGRENHLMYFSMPGGRRAPTWNDDDGSLHLRGYIVEYDPEHLVIDEEPKQPLSPEVTGEKESLADSLPSRESAHETASSDAKDALQIDSRPLPTSDGLSKEVRQLFAGKVLDFKPNTLEIELAYDFRSKKQAEDWVLSEWRNDNINCYWEIADGKTRINCGRPILHKAVFTDVTANAGLSIGNNIEIAGGGPFAAVCCRASGRGDFYYLSWLPRKQAGAGLEKMIGRKWVGLQGSYGSDPFINSRTGNLMISVAGDQLKGQIHDRTFGTHATELKQGHVGLIATNASFDSVHMAGILDQEWLDKNIRRVSRLRSMKRPTLLDLRKRFAGDVHYFNARTRRIKISYDFSSPRQGSDWRLAGHRRVGEWGIANGKLTMKNSGRILLLAPVFDDAKIQGDFEVMPGGYGDACFVIGARIRPDARYSWYGLEGLQKYEKCHLFHTTIGPKSHDTRFLQPTSYGIGPSSPFIESRKGSCALSRTGHRVYGNVGQLTFEAFDTENLSGQVGLWAASTHTHFDNVQIDGVFNKRWYEDFLLGNNTPQERSPPSQPAEPAVSKRTVLIPRKEFVLNAQSDGICDIVVPELISPHGTLEIIVENMGDDTGDKKMYVYLLDSDGDQVADWNGSKDGLFKRRVPSASKWRVVLQDHDTATVGKMPSNKCWVEISIVPD